jgi:hypothetical protein
LQVALLTAAHPTKLKFNDSKAACAFACCCVDPAAAAAAAATEDPKETLIARQAAEIARLTKQLEATHGHYQKQLEGLGGGLGPTERGGGGAELETFAAGTPRKATQLGGTSVKSRGAGRRPQSGASSKKTGEEGASAEEVTTLHTSHSHPPVRS